ncbi:Hypothetical predicted protein [Mytilus galloprovincialis]|uniref:DOMON domain-containing protein n=1 Tax=Mytilus galloprovincialis TaxID=29158 RepID=A0A8B6GQ58_MYTGA|nr:Hypothetical predicted protein [Mytilus galloprovincialis]
MVCNWFSLIFLFGLYQAYECSDAIDSVQKLIPVHSKPVPTSVFQHEIQLDPDGNFWLFWNVSGTNITFETHVRTRGYVGFGLSQNGKMFPSDVIVSWINSDGSVYFRDCHTVGNVVPKVDSNQNWYLINGFENDFGTVLTFSRKLDTCDEDDIVINDDTIRTIYSYHEEDPISMTEMQWHGEKRGAQSVMFLSSSKSLASIPNNSIKVDIVTPPYSIHLADTRHCSLHKIPPLTKKHHMIRYEPLIQKESLAFVHHIVISKCPDTSDADVGSTYDCFSTSTPDRFMTCSDPVVAWAVGGLAFNMPKHVGFAFGEADSPKYVKLEIHYSNPSMKSGIVDRSGIRMFLSPDIRQYDAAGMTIGVNPNPTHIIPPYQKSFVSTSYCNPQCTEKGLPDTGISIFGAFQHAHVLGRAIKTRHIRNGKELPPIAEDKTYDFNYQDIRTLKEERKVKRGDSFMVECTYDSSKKNKSTTGGMSTGEEMCISYIYYYPRTNMSFCLASPLYDQISKDSEKAFEQLKDWNWNDKHIRQQFQQLVNNSTYNTICNGPIKLESHSYKTVIPNPEYPYHKPSKSCKNSIGMN